MTVGGTSETPTQTHNTAANKALSMCAGAVAGSRAYKFKIDVFDSANLIR